MQISQATQGAPGRVNEDYAAAGSGWALVLDGATPTPGVISGCIHDVSWLVRRLAAALAPRLTRPGQGALADLLAGAIIETRNAHAGTCDLENPDSPSSTVALARIHGASLEYLVLCDSPILLRRRDGQVIRIADDRIARLPCGPPYTTDQIRAARNRPSGFWVASTNPEAAYRAVQGSASLDAVTDVALLTDGVTRLAEWYGYSWPEVFARLRQRGPAGLIGLLRAAERAYPHPRLKRHDDATVVHMRR
jgi:hypothetical protein